VCPLFPFGQTVATQGALAALERAKHPPACLAFYSLRSVASGSDLIFISLPRRTVPWTLQMYSLVHRGELHINPPCKAANDQNHNPDDDVG
jgi:hypothetical protein